MGLEGKHDFSHAEGCGEHKKWCMHSFNAMTHQLPQLLSRVRSGPVGVCVKDLQLDCLLHSSLVQDCLVRSGRPYDSTVELGWAMCHGLYLVSKWEAGVQKTSDTALLHSVACPPFL